jgi:peptidoglycan/LPS O-acetylase OafA/YrhL
MFRNPPAVSDTLGRKLADSPEHTSGFDYLRLVFAVSIIAWHTVMICYGPAVETALWTGPFRPLLYFVIPAFFALSGFLVAGSLVRVNQILSFLALRILRIFPALCCEVLISALLIGPLLTEESLRNYFSDPRFSDYFLNLIGDIHYALPGLFYHNIVTSVNLQLWTIPYELVCYGLIAGLAAVRLARYPLSFGIASLAFTIGASVADQHAGRLILNDRPPEYLTVACFLWGIFFYLCRYRIPCNALLFGGAVLAAWMAFTQASTSYAAAIPVAYITVYLGLMNPRKIFPVSTGDYSYGLYLYGFPIQQAVCALLPQYRVWYVHFPVSLLLSGICAYLSWTFLESQVLGRKKSVVAFVTRLSGRIHSALPSPLTSPVFPSRQ